MFPNLDNTDEDIRVLEPPKSIEPEETDTVQQAPRNKEPYPRPDLDTNQKTLASAPIHKLPTKLLEKLSKQIAYVDLSKINYLDSEGSMSMEKAPILFLQVCQHWRRIVLFPQTLLPNNNHILIHSISTQTTSLMA
ncbi:hypothetical protein M422DRAFT_69115 [Sphaerobolus stellatus SS14]|uniref:F-box domain-containing protein n=1 Tax=Sphaerobolus stellatus (strain SS14) TaxID=990650 RepID=A0A0C9UUJ8_SPHS4|nr:hypothetical protein M422DRAFT_53085 [Sphaerobolus stellatus SS14]KIJ38544.1 hypothetical protein M422DRAFT_69115 [Sphaerobolus stellatus SS14]